MAKRFRFVSPGEVLVGVVFDRKGKPINNIRHIEDYRNDAMMFSADQEPEPILIPVHCEFTPEDNGPADLVDLRNPELKILECA